MIERTKDLEREQERRRDDALRRALGMRPIHRKGKTAGPGSAARRAFLVRLATALGRHAHPQ